MSEEKVVLSRTTGFRGEAKSVELLGQEAGGKELFKQILWSCMACCVRSQEVKELSHIKGLHPHGILETMYCVSGIRSVELVPPITGDQTLFQNDSVIELLAMTATLESVRSYHVLVDFIKCTARRYLASNAAVGYSHGSTRR